MRASRLSKLSVPGLAAVLVICVGAGVALAAGGGGANDPSKPTCNEGWVYDQEKGVCVREQSGIVPDDNFANYAYALAKEGRYQEALDTLALMKNPNTAEALNYRGYATRKLGRIEEGVGYYLQSVKLNANYTQVREYLGEAYIQLGRMDLAREQLRAIGKICGERLRQLSAARRRRSAPRSNYHSHKRMPAALFGGLLRFQNAIRDARSGQIFPEEIDCPRPGQIGRRLVVTHLRGVVVEGVIDAVIHEDLKVDARRLECRLVSGNAGIDALVQPRVVEQELRLDPWRPLRRSVADRNRRRRHRAKDRSPQAGWPCRRPSRSRPRRPCR